MLRPNGTRTRTPGRNGSVGSSWRQIVEQPHEGGGDGDFEDQGGRHRTYPQFLWISLWTSGLKSGRPAKLVNHYDNLSIF